jgi:hypothetical protein
LLELVLMVQLWGDQEVQVWTWLPSTWVCKQWAGKKVLPLLLLPALELFQSL